MVRLSRDIPRFKNHKLLDNYYTCVPLVVNIFKEGILSLGTIRRNRIPDSKLPSEANMKKMPRGSSIEYTATVNSVHISNIVWKDNKSVTLLSSFVGKEPQITVKRYDRKRKAYLDVNCPQMIAVYNKHMGGVDLLDSHIGRHRIKLRSKKWYFRIFYHLIDLAVINAWLLYKRVCLVKNAKPVNQKQFRVELARSLCMLGKKGIKRARPSTGIEEQLEIKRKKCPSVKIPPKDVRKDSVEHWPEWKEKRGRCKYPSCSRLTFVSCSKYKTNLCFNKNSNCFQKFYIS